VTSTSSETAFEPDAALIRHYAIKYRWDAEKLREVLCRFGPMPKGGQEKMILLLVQAFGALASLGKNVRKFSANQTADRVDALVKSSSNLLAAVGIQFHHVDWNIFDEPFVDRPATWRLEAFYNRQEKAGDVQSKGREALFALSIASASLRHSESPPDIEAINAELRADSEKVAEAILHVIWLHRQSVDAQKWIEPRRSKQRGGAEASLKQTGLLIREGIEIYEEMRAEHPDSDGTREIGLGGPLIRFVQSVAALFGTQVSNAKVEDSWRDRLRRKRNRK